MSKKQPNLTKYNVIWAFILFIIVLLGVMFYNNRLLNTTEEVNLAHGSAPATSDKTDLKKKKADLMVKNFKFVPWDCDPNLSGRRQVMFYFDKVNIWSIVSSEYYEIVYVNSSFFVWWYPSYGFIQPGQMLNWWFWWILQWWTKIVKVSIIPVNHMPNGINWPVWANYTNRSLDANPNNNSISEKIYVKPCP